MTQESTIIVVDADRTIRFTGVLLGASSSAAADKKRWSEISVYRTQAGSWVVAGCGMTSIEGENNRCWASVCERARGVIEKLHLYDSHGTRYMPYVAQRALREACDADEDLAAEYALQDVS